MTDKTMPDELYAVPVNNFYIASPHRTEPHDTKYHHHRIVEQLQEHIKQAEGVADMFKKQRDQAIAENKALREALTEALDIAEQNIEDPDTVLIEHLKQTLKGNE